MTRSKAEALLRQNGGFYLTCMLLLLGIKYFYSVAGTGLLKWILTPTAWWVGILSGLPFSYEAGAGYVNHSIRFLIAPSCCGIQFMLITMATLFYSFVHLIGTNKGCRTLRTILIIKKKLGWMGFCLLFSYFYTIFVNGLRIVLSIYLPLSLPAELFSGGWLTPERFHTMLGAAVYFTFLFILYSLAGKAAGKMAAISRKEQDFPPEESFQSHLRSLLLSCIPPVFWYFAIALGIPFFNRAYKNNGEAFAEYTGILVTVCASVLFFFCLITLFRKHHGTRKT